MLTEFELFDSRPLLDNMVRQFESDKRDNLREELMKCADERRNDEDMCSYAYRTFMCFNENNFQMINTNIRRV